MIGVHSWWKAMAGERFWLGVPGRDGERDVLGAPRAPGRGGETSVEPLIAHVRDGDAVLHYDEEQRAIVGWSTARGHARKRDLYWSEGTRSPNANRAEPRILPSWAIGLAGTKTLRHFVPIEDIARVQWDLFPALRAFEDEVGAPLYYPFAMDSRSESRLLPGCVFKLPSLFVGSFAALATVPAQVPWAVDASAGSEVRPAVGLGSWPWRESEAPGAEAILRETSQQPAGFALSSPRKAVR